MSISANSTASSLQMHPTYAGIIEKAYASHKSFRDPKGISPSDIVHARLYVYAFRRHVIGTFDATRKALAEIPISDAHIAIHRQRAVESLEDLGNQAMSAVPKDFRVVIDTLHRTHRRVLQAIESLNAEHEICPQAALAEVNQRFLASMNRITSGNGIELVQDTSAPEQECFVVPNLGITIVPLVYGEHHSWNLAYLSGSNRDVPPHAHHCGVEIHLGFNPTHGETILGNTRTKVDEGYAMPIPPKTVHGWTNQGEALHHVPFIFGSMVHGGWGVFFDVEPQMDITSFVSVPRDEAQFQYTVHLERSIDSSAQLLQSKRTILIESGVTCRDSSGGLELAVIRANADGFAFPVDEFRAVSVVRGTGLLTIEDVTQTVAAHDHFGIPSGMKATVRQIGAEPMVLLDSLIRDK